MLLMSIYGCLEGIGGNWCYSQFNINDLNPQLQHYCRFTTEIYVCANWLSVCMNCHHIP